MEHRQPHEIANRLLEARVSLRSHIALETTLLERIGELPEDDFCHFARETFQMGAGYAYHQRHEAMTTIEDAFSIFFATQPRNRYLDHEVVVLEEKRVALAALQFVETGAMPDLESHIDPYQVEAAAAFTEGFMLASSLLPRESSAVESA